MMTLKQELDLQVELFKVIVKRISKTNDHGEFQMACQMILKKISEDFGGTKHVIKIREVPNHSHDE